MEKANILDVYTDESTSNKGRFKSICAVSGLSESLRELENKLKNILKSHNLSELKFAAVKTYKPKIDCAKDFISIAVDYASAGKIRIDVIIWDLHDMRHAVPRRDDKENLERMYFHLLKNIALRWNIFSCRFYPDQHTEYEYIKIIFYLENTEIPKSKPGILKLFEEEGITFRFLEVKQQKSEEQPLIQLADLFAGFACFSRKNSDKFKIYKKYKENPKIESFYKSEFSKAELNRFKLIEFIKTCCEQKRIEVSLNTNNYLRTYKPKFPINFWHYEPQGDYDKAPTKPIKIIGIDDIDY